jgi:2-dehydropantoate 2-reductase
MDVLVYGAGAVGLGISSSLIESGASVSIVARKRTVEILSSSGIRRTGIFGVKHHNPDSFSAAAVLDPFVGKTFDYVLICTKSFDTAPAAEDLARLIPDAVSESTPRFVLFQNGWGNRDIFARYIPPEIVFNARVITGFTRTSPAEVDITVHADDVRVGYFEGGRMEEIAPLCETIRAGGVPCSFTESIIEDIWAKMLYNCALNSLGALFEVSYGELADDPSSRELLDRIIDECFDVMTAAGFKTHWENAATYREAFYGTLIPATRDHYPSTLQDMRAGKRTEIDALNGAVVDLAEKHGVGAPYNRMAYSMVKFKEARQER